MKLFLLSFVLLAAAAVSHADSAGCPKYQYEVYAETGRSREGLEAILMNFREALGSPDNANEIGPLSSGHRSVRVRRIKLHSKDPIANEELYSSYHSIFSLNFS